MLYPLVCYYRTGAETVCYQEVQVKHMGVQNTDIMDLIPSRDMRQYLKETGYRFSDREQLSIIYWRVRLLEEFRFWMQGFIQTAEDKVLIDGVKTCLAELDRYVAAFQQKAETGKEIFRTILSYDDSSTKGEQFSGDYLTAFEYGLQFGDNFTIEKLRISDSTENMKANLVTMELSFDCDGQIRVPEDEIIWENIPDIFNGAVNAPIPFKNGDIVTVLEGNGQTYSHHAVINIGNSDPLTLNADYSDFVLFCEYYDDGSKEFCHEHVSPFFLEFCRDKKELEYPSILEAARALITGNRRITLEEFTLQLHDPYQLL